MAGPLDVRRLLAIVNELEGALGDLLHFLGDDTNFHLLALRRDEDVNHLLAVGTPPTRLADVLRSRHWRLHELLELDPILAEEFQTTYQGRLMNEVLDALHGRPIERDHLPEIIGRVRSLRAQLERLLATGSALAAVADQNQRLEARRLKARLSIAAFLGCADLAMLFTPSAGSSWWSVNLAASTAILPKAIDAVAALLPEK